MQIVAEVGKGPDRPAPAQGDPFHVGSVRILRNLTEQGSAHGNGEVAEAIDQEQGIAALRSKHLPGRLRCLFRVLAGRLAGLAIGSTDLGRDLPNVLRILDDLPEPTASAAFSRTLRAVVDWRGQIVTMLDRCYLTEAIPVQIIWGSRDVVVPVRHARMAHAAMPGSRLEIFQGSGHFPFHDDPARFIDVVQRFIDTTEPAEYDQAALRQLLRTGSGAQTVSGPADTRVAVLNAMGSDERSAT